MFLPPSDIRSKAVLLNCFHLRNFTSLVDYTLKINMEHVLMEVWFRSFSFLDGWFAGSMVIFQSVMVNRWFWAPVVWDSNRDTPKLRVPFIFGDRSNPNYRAPNHQLTMIQVTGRKWPSLKRHRVDPLQNFDAWKMNFFLSGRVCVGYMWKKKRNKKRNVRLWHVKCEIKPHTKYKI